MKAISAFSIDSASDDGSSKETPTRYFRVVCCDYVGSDGDSARLQSCSSGMKVAS